MWPSIKAGLLAAPTAAALTVAFIARVATGEQVDRTSSGIPRVSGRLQVGSYRCDVTGSVEANTGLTNPEYDTLRKNALPSQSAPQVCVSLSDVLIIVGAKGDVTSFIQPAYLVHGATLLGQNI
ncbi:hypothetical protein NP493_965g01014 [Ridgeia piscesae]|uniref:Uncharacterized protein n=1 Tax=Ridgeia piscesae TaxID=27915 RepID=A0AAD9KJR1_RIDPI|nr:hypothetical protein NP493_965g01014 [Ridgeia piscesae]